MESPARWQWHGGKGEGCRDDELHEAPGDPHEKPSIGTALKAPTGARPYQPGQRPRTHPKTAEG